MKKLVMMIFYFLLFVSVLILADTAEESALEVEKWQAAYTQLQQDYSQAVERIEYLEHKLVTEPISEELKQEIENNVPGEADSDEV